MDISVKNLSAASHLISGLKHCLRISASLTLLLTFSELSSAAQPLSAVAPYLQPNAPVFSDTVARFREQFNHDNPQLPLPEYRTVETGQPAGLVVLAVSRVSSDLYSSTALEPGTGKIKSLQMTWIAHKTQTEKNSRDLAFRYMSALIRFFSPLLSPQESQQKLEALLNTAKENKSITENEGALRYVIASHRDNSLTLAIEPVRLTLPDH